MKPFEQLKQQWQQEKAKAAHKNAGVDTQELVKEAKLKKRVSTSAHIITIIVLSTTLIGIIAFFYFVAPFQTVLSRIGIGLMCGGLLIRIILEVVSLRKSQLLRFDDQAKLSALASERFYNYRVKIHGAITYVIVAAYVIGFYMLTPEFMQYLAFRWILLMDVGFVVIAVVMILLIRKGVIEELNVLKRINSITSALEE